MVTLGLLPPDPFAHRAWPKPCPAKKEREAPCLTLLLDPATHCADSKGSFHVISCRIWKASVRRCKGLAHVNAQGMDTITIHHLDLALQTRHLLPAHPNAANWDGTVTSEHQPHQVTAIFGPKWSRTLWALLGSIITKVAQVFQQTLTPHGRPLMDLQSR